MITSTNPFLNFNGDAEAALALYAAALGGEVVDLRRFSTMPGADVPEALAERIMYARLQFPGGALELSDMPPGMSAEPGSNTDVILHTDAPADVDRLLGALAEGGKVLMAVEDTFWGARYGCVVDRFGIRWAAHCALEGAR